ncbi:hypothetical protein KEM60_01628 [Austwickia sp. TVS 96-490-7B]|uniref:VWA domain-containing protein n=1 Tax=Austwickia sp. TVS 96-490-7B TaxID=2830843 RepID=UPI001C599809|nr:vWA domain-containing protein [Austwickia sp. TVS 96-490-7B]MBW3085428.1 hypothetical protein [Austwickia sp. TVS 96-490-7B]
MIAASAITLVIVLAIASIALWRQNNDNPAATSNATASGSTPDGARGTTDAERTVALKHAGRIVFVVDTSNGMGPWLDAAKDGVSSLVATLPDEVSAGLITYSSSGANVGTPIAPANAGQRGQLSDAMRSLKAGGGPGPLPDALLLGYQNAVNNAAPNTAPLVVVITASGMASGTDISTLTSFIQADASNRVTAARVVALAGTGADRAPLDKAASTTHGRVDAVKDADELRTAIRDVAVSKGGSGS